MPFSSIFLTLALTAVPVWVIVYLYRSHASFHRSLPLPPGPRPLPLIGNLADIPTSREYETYASWGKEYGDVVHVSALGQHIIILNSIEAANELLDRRSAIYSSRPFVPMLHDPALMDIGWAFSLQQYSPVWKRHRRLFAQYLNPTAARAFFNRQTSSAHALLRSLLHTPTELEAHLRHTAADILLGITYGHNATPTNDPLVELAEQMLKKATEGILPGRFLVNSFPWLKYVPAWFPGTEFKALATEARNLGQHLIHLPYEKLKAQMAEGTAPPSFVTNALSDISDDSPPELEREILEVAAAMYGAGVETTLYSVHSCILGLILNPFVQTRAQAELDAILGAPTSPTFRLPTFNDRPSLPYIDAILKESLRWITVVASGIPHATIEEDVYRGWRIPKGSIVMANAWAILHDEKRYPNPLAFHPERFLSTEGRTPDPDPAVSGTFGFGRRICPGRPLAEASLWIEIASLLSVFSFSPAKDQEGREIDVTYAILGSQDLFMHPLPFPCKIKPRSREAEARICETDPERMI